MRERLANVRAQLGWAVEEYRLAHLARLLLFLVCIWFAAAVCIWQSERRVAHVPGQAAPRFHTLSDCLWCSTVYLVSGLEDFEPQTPLAKTAAVVVMVVGVGVLGLVGASLVATCVERTRRAAFVRRKPGCVLREHTVICGWNSKGDAIIRELHADQWQTRMPVVIVAPDALDIEIQDRSAYRGVWAVAGDPVSDDALHDANVATARSAVILTAEADTPAAQAAAEAKTVLVSLALEALQPQLHACVEITSGRTAERLARGAHRELIDVRNVAGKLIAHAGQRHFLTGFFEHLLTVSAHTNEVYVVDVPAPLVGLTFREAQKRLLQHERSDVVLAGVETHDPAAAGADDTGGRLMVNPTGFPTGATGSTSSSGRDRRLRADDRLVVIARTKPELAQFV